MPIAELHPELAEADKCFFQGVVTLLWPYSSSSKSLSLLLVEPDFRLRARHGQVRLVFRGASAKALSKSEVTSGDQLTSSLRGVTWARDDSAASTPGKGIEWQLQYGEFLDLKVCANSTISNQLLSFLDKAGIRHDDIHLHRSPCAISRPQRLTIWPTPLQQPHSHIVS